MPVLINIKEILGKDVGAKQELPISIQLSDIEGVDITAPIVGEVSITRLDDRILANFNIHLDVSLECARCLDSYIRKLSQIFSVEYIDEEKEDMPIEGMYFIRDEKIDLEEPIKQEILVNLPIAGLCRPKCLGLCQTCGINLNNEDCDCEEIDKTVSNRNHKTIGDVIKKQKNL